MRILSIVKGLFVAVLREALTFSTVSFDFGRRMMKHHQCSWLMESHIFTQRLKCFCSAVDLIVNFMLPESESVARCQLGGWCNSGGHY